MFDDLYMYQALGIGASRFDKYARSQMKIFVVYKMTTIWPHLVESRCHFSSFHLYLIPILLSLLKIGWNLLTDIKISSHTNLPNMDNLI